MGLKGQSFNTGGLDRLDSIKIARPHLWEEWRNNWSGHIVLSLQCNEYIHCGPGADVVSVLDLVRHLNVRITVAESRHVGHLGFTEL